MIEYNEYARRPASYWIGKRVKLDRDIGTRGGITYPAGSVARIKKKFKGFEIEGDACKCCGVKLHISRLESCYLSLVEDGQ